MLCIISYNLKGADKDHKALYDKIDSLGNSYRCNSSLVLLHTLIDAGLVDAALRSVFKREDSYLVVDITGIDEEKYFGHIPARARDDRFWTWLKNHNN